MSIGLKSFRKKAFGGFDERDVIEYLGQVSAERAEQVKKIEALEAENRDLRDEIALLEQRLDEAKADSDELRRREKEYRVTVLDDAEHCLKELEEMYAAASGELEERNRAAEEECAALSARFAGLSQGLKDCGSGLRGLYAKIAESRMKLDGYLCGDAPEEEIDGDL